MKKRVLSIMIAATLVFGIAGCGNTGDAGQTASVSTAEGLTAASAEQSQDQAATEASGELKILKTATSFAYPSLDVHKE